MSGPAPSTGTARKRTAPIGRTQRQQSPLALSAPGCPAGAVSRSRASALRARVTSERASTLPAGVGHYEVVPDRFEVRADPWIERRAGSGGRDDAAEHLVGLAEPAVGEVGLQASRWSSSRMLDCRRSRYNAVPNASTVTASATVYQRVSRRRMVVISGLHDVAHTLTVCTSFCAWPESTFLRRRLITTSTMLVPGSKW